MNKKNTKNLILGILIFLLFFYPMLGIYSAKAATSSISNYYSNPNQNYSNNPYKFNIKNVMNSETLTAVVGCTGIVNRVASWMSTIMQSKKIEEAIKKQARDAIKDQMKAACNGIKTGTMAGAGAIPLTNDMVSSVKTAYQRINVKILGEKDKTKACLEQVESVDPKTLDAISEQNKQSEARDYKEQCFDGIAIALAKNQLTSLTRSAMNWVNTGFGGNPFFVQNAQNLINNISEGVVETGIDALLAPKNPSPYAQDFAKATIAQRGIVSSSAGLLGSLTSDLANFVTDPRSIYSDSALDKASNADTAEQTAYNAKLATESFANNFSLGGWNAWLALTQKEKNNPLGFNMLANQYLSEMQAQKTTEITNELAQNNGFMSQKICDQWQMYYGSNYDNGSSTGKPINANMVNDSKSLIPTLVKIKPNEDQTNGQNYGVCFHWKVVTPGSLIKDKISNYLGSPERQLEMVKTINDSLNALFSVLISKLEGGGLTGLSDSAVSTNWTDNLNTLRDNSSSSDSSSGNSYDNNGAYNGFDITKDLGNTYIHDDVKKIGTWDAELNITDTKNPQDGISEKLYPDIAPVTYAGLDANGNTITITSKNVYYEVTKPGKSKIISDGFNSWQKGDRAFWDGEKWQNWKLGQQSPIKNRGVIQIQQDYIVAAKEILKVIPGIMPALGELDYCLPGPNPSYKTNSTDAQSAFSDWVNSAYVGVIDTTGERYGVSIDGPGSLSYNSLQSVYKNNTLWSRITSATIGSAQDALAKLTYNNESNYLNMPWLQMFFNNVCNKHHPGEGLSMMSYDTDSCRGNYIYKPDNKDQGHLDFKNSVRDYLTNLVNSYMFEKFYDSFDKEMNDKYFKKMTDKYIEQENKTLDINTDLNPAYVPMAESGFSFTSNILNYYNDSVDAQSTYTSAISQAKINVAKLEPIKQEVSKIISDAQNRRYKKLADLENTTVENIKTKYKSCFDEENIKFYDADSITSENEYRSTEACSDGIDNDLDGLADNKDPDCQTAEQQNNERRILTPPEGKVNLDSND